MISHMILPTEETDLERTTGGRPTIGDVDEENFGRL